MRNFSLVLVLVLVAALSMPVMGEQVTLTLQYRNEADVVAAWITEFEALHPHIKVEWEVRPGGDWQAQNIVRMAAGTAPDVLEFWGAFGQDLSRRGLLLELNPYVARDFSPEEIADFYPVAWESSFANFGPRAGAQYFLPRYINIMVFHYNKDLFERAGLENPAQLDARGEWTWDTMRAYARLLTQQDGQTTTQHGVMISTGSMPRMLNWVWGAGGDFFHPEDPTQFVGHEADAVAGIQFLHDLIWQDGTMPATDSGSLFQQGRVAMFETGMSEIPLWMNNITDFQWDTVRKPAGPAGRPGYLVDDSFGIWSGTPHPDEAWLLLKFLTSRRGQELVVEHNKLPPVRGSASQAYFEIDPSRNLQAFADAVADGRPSIVTRIAGDVAQVSDVLTTTLRSVLRTNSQPYAIAAQEMRTRINSIIAETMDR